MNKPYLIAEIGINHNGDLNITKKLIDNAKDCGFNCVKFQKRTIDIVYDKSTLDFPRQSPWGNTTKEQKLGLEFEKLEYSFSKFENLKIESEKENIENIKTNKHDTKQGFAERRSK